MLSNSCHKFILCGLSIIALVMILLVNFTLPPPLSKALAKSPSVPVGIPDQFVSISDAKAYVQKLFAGGSAEEIYLNKKKFLLIRRYGSGVYDISISLYHQQNSSWQHNATFSPINNGTVFENHDVKIIGSRVVVIGSTSKKKWILWEEN